MPVIELFCLLLGQRRQAVRTRRGALRERVVSIAPLKQGDRQRERVTIPFLAQGETAGDGGAVHVVAQAHAQITLRDLGRVFHDDIDRPCHRLGTLVGRWPLGYFDALHLRRVQLVQGEAGGCRVTVDQHQGVARPQAPHARRVALHGDARQAFEHIGHIGVTIAVEFFAAIDLLGHLGAPAQIVTGLLA